MLCTLLAQPKDISFEGKAVPIPQDQIDNLRIIVDKNAEVETSWQKHKKGEKIKVNGGPLKGLEGILVSAGNRDYSNKYV